jgi:hypothetical protein
MNGALRHTLAVALALSAASAGSAAKASSLRDLEGAWVADEAACAATYRFSRGGFDFRANADLFASAFIVDKQRIRTPLASCLIRSAKSDGNWLNVQLACENGVSHQPVQARFSVVQSGLVVRRMGAPVQGQGEAPSGSAFYRCVATQE